MIDKGIIKERLDKLIAQKILAEAKITALEEESRLLKKHLGIE